MQVTIQTSNRTSPPAAPSPANGPVPHEAGRLAIVGGCGHVGLPLGMAFARAGCPVDLIDTSAERVAQVNRGRMPFQEEGADALLPVLVQSGRLRADTQLAAVATASAVIVTIGTPVDEYHDPSVRRFDRAIDPVLSALRPGQLLVLRSTVFPGTTRRLGRRLVQMGRGGVDLAFCPERIIQGASLEELEHLPQLVGGTTARAAERAAELFRRICRKVIPLEPIEAELAKLFCNAYRYINFAIANQFSMLAEQHGADFGRIHQAMRQDYPRVHALARPGFAAGPCLVKDTLQLGAFNRDSFVLGQAAIQVNEGLPGVLVQRLKRSYPLADMTVGILGMAFKPNNDDPRDSLSYKLRKVLQVECRHVLCTDPYVPDPELRPVEEVLAQADLIVVGTPHDCYRGLTFCQPVIDITGTVAAGLNRPASPAAGTAAGGFAVAPSPGSVGASPAPVAARLAPLPGCETAS
jgi:UDP-N-acetyl-D-mannosaminuronic acid dehydrogenase